MLRRRVLGPRQRHEARVALLHQRARGGARALEAEAHVGGEPQLARRSRARWPRPRGSRRRRTPTRAGTAAVVEHRLAVEVHLHLAVHAAHGAQQHVVGVVVGRRAPVRVRAVVLVVPRPDQQHVADDDPAAAGAPARLEHHRARQVAAVGGHLHVGRAEPEHAGVAVEDRAEHARRVEARQAQPLDVAARRDQRGGLAVGQEAVVGDRREGAARTRPTSADGVAHGAAAGSTIRGRARRTRLAGARRVLGARRTPGARPRPCPRRPPGTRPQRPAFTTGSVRVTRDTSGAIPGVSHAHGQALPLAERGVAREQRGGVRVRARGRAGSGRAPARRRRRPRCSSRS